MEIRDEDRVMTKPVGLLIIKHNTEYVEIYTLWMAYIKLDGMPNTGFDILMTYAKHFCPSANGINAQLLQILVF